METTTKEAIALTEKEKNDENLKEKILILKEFIVKYYEGKSKITTDTDYIVEISGDIWSLHPDKIVENAQIQTQSKTSAVLFKKTEIKAEFDLKPVRKKYSKPSSIAQAEFIIKLESEDKLTSELELDVKYIRGNCTNKQANLIIKLALDGKRPLIK